MEKAPILRVYDAPPLPSPPLPESSCNFIMKLNWKRMMKSFIVSTSTMSTFLLLLLATEITFSEEHGTPDSVQVCKHYLHQHRDHVGRPPVSWQHGVPSWCSRSQQNLPAADDIDPRYGVEKQRIPTGPNPLHN
ncbi:hypothetical protein Cni_G01000 [Canna indica]|uniref:Uncharacterized protein n=1 Tax=Canna indica TaxID=4628 RepID=A0AAQ3JNU0_9LILI|nr:hypothetical protein Cni_G01000 [Canna indica]